MSRGILILLLSVVIASVSQILLKKSAARQYASFLQEYLNPYVIIGYGMMVASMFLTVVAYREIDYKNGPVIESAGYILVMVFSYFIFREKITKRKLLGVLCILCGIFVFYM
ncbi:MAG: EamA family transporter [Lachnospiraceae bacterium]|nr:EamA family transporter [Lachnospiraceae bacterium]